MHIMTEHINKDTHYPCIHITNLYSSINAHHFYFCTGDVTLQCDSEIANATKNVTLTPKSKGFYLFRCDVIGSVKLTWETSDSPSFTVLSFTGTGYTFSNDINYVIGEVEEEDGESNTNFTSYMWFDSKDFQPRFVKCSSADFSAMALFGNTFCCTYIFSLAF